AGVVVVETLVKGVREVHSRGEADAADFTWDTIGQAAERHQQRVAEVNELAAHVHADAGMRTAGAKGAVNAAAAADEEIAKRLEAGRPGTQEAVGRGIEAVHAALETLKSRLGEVEQAVGKAQAQVNDATAKMAEAYKGLTSIVEANLQQQIQAVKARYDQ